jgi:hypothetical protein
MNILRFVLVRLACNGWSHFGPALPTQKQLKLFP